MTRDFGNTANTPRQHGATEHSTPPCDLDAVRLYRLGRVREALAARDLVGIILYEEAHGPCLITSVFAGRAGPVMRDERTWAQLIHAAARVLCPAIFGNLSLGVEVAAEECEIVIVDCDVSAVREHGREGDRTTRPHLI